MSPFRAMTRLLLAAACWGCASDVVAPDAALEGLPEGLRVELTVEPSVVAPRGSFTARLTVTNTTMRALTVVTAHGCLAIPHVMRGDTRVPFEGSWWGCTAAITSHVFAPGETRTRDWAMRAELYAEHPGDTGGVAAPRGTYRVRAEFDTYSPNGGKPAIERALVVR